MAGHPEDWAYGSPSREYLQGHQQGSFERSGLEPEDLAYYEKMHPDRHRRQSSFDDNHVTRYVDWAKSRKYDPDEVNTLKRYEREPGVGRAHTNFLADQLYVGGGDQDWRRSVTASTDGKIVGLCPGCNRAIRSHSTMHGDELRHLHNDHVRCFGKTSAGGPGMLEAVDLAGKGVKALEDEAEKPVDEWAQRVESVLQFAADYLGRPDAQNPTGKGPDEYRARTWDGYLSTRPLQSSEDRKVNTPVLAQEPMKTRNINTPTQGLNGREDDLQVTRDEDKDDDD